MVDYSEKLIVGQRSGRIFIPKITRQESTYVALDMGQQSFSDVVNGAGTM